MQFVYFIVRLFFLMALMGTLVAPVSAFAAQNAMAAMESSSVNAPAEMDHMSCCPDEKPVRTDCGFDCPLVTLCTGSAAAYATRADWTPARLAYSDLHFDPASGNVLASRAAQPPAKPPKS